MYVTFRCSLFSILRVPDKTVPESFHIEVNLPSLTQTCPQPTNTCNFPRLCDAIALRFLKDTTAKLGFLLILKCTLFPAVLIDLRYMANIKRWKQNVDVYCPLPSTVLVIDCVWMIWKHLPNWTQGTHLKFFTLISPIFFLECDFIVYSFDSIWRLFLL